MAWRQPSVALQERAAANARESWRGTKKQAAQLQHATSTEHREGREEVELHPRMGTPARAAHAVGEGLEPPDGGADVCAMGDPPGDGSNKGSSSPASANQSKDSGEHIAGTIATLMGLHLQEGKEAVAAEVDAQRHPAARAFPRRSPNDQQDQLHQEHSNP